MSPLQLLARDVGVNERTLRRAVTQGTLHARRPSPRKLEIPLTEQQYVRRSWTIISLLRSALRTEHNVRFALLFGSCALGTDGPDSDVDVLVALRDPDLPHLIDLKTRLTDVLGRRVDLVVLDQAKQEPSFLAQVLGEGRVLVDRDDRWHSLRAQQRRLRQRGAKLDAQRIGDALAGIDRVLAR
jgi:predicted nucleotidyltransferase